MKKFIPLRDANASGIPAAWVAALDIITIGDTRYVYGSQLRDALGALERHAATVAVTDIEETRKA